MPEVHIPMFIRSSNGFHGGTGVPEPSICSRPLIQEADCKRSRNRSLSPGGSEAAVHEALTHEFREIWPDTIFKFDM